MNDKLICRFDKRSGFSFEGSASAYKEFLEFLLGGGTEYRFLIPGASAGPYEIFVEKFLVENTKGKLKIYSSDKSLVCSGEKRFLDILMSNILGFSKQEYSEGMHSHIEYFEGHSFLDVEAEPIVLGRTR